MPRKDNAKHKIWMWDDRYKGDFRIYSGSGVAKNFSWRFLKFWNGKNWKKLRDFLSERHKLGRVILPAYNYDRIFRALYLTPFDRVKIVILGQDPYFQKGVADGLAFSILPNKVGIPTYERQRTDNKVLKDKGTIAIRKLPGSLGEIFKEYREDLGYPYPRSGDLSTWARNGILLINAVWTVEEGRPLSHYRVKGSSPWAELTAEIIGQLSERKNKLVFILWGKKAQEWRYMIDETKHLVLASAHPSPRNKMFKQGNPEQNFLGGRYFSKACEYLDISKTIWRLP